MLTQKVLSRYGTSGEALDRSHVRRRRVPDPSTVIPNRLLGSDSGQLSELCRCEAVLTDVFVEEHAHRVTKVGTAVNILFADKSPRIGYPRGMKYPNRLGELMSQHPGGKLTDPDVANAMWNVHRIRTSKQQINKLRLGQRKLTREWATQLAPILGRTWPEIMGWSGELPAVAAPDPAAIYKTAGARIAWARIYRKIEDPAEAARRFAIPLQRLIAIESGETQMTILELGTISAKLRVSSDFLLRGAEEHLTHQVAEAWEKYLKDLRSDPPMNTG